MRFSLLILFLLPFSILAQSNFEKGDKLFKSEKYDQSKPFFEKALKENPNDLKAIECLGDIQSFHKDWEAAVPYYEKLTILKPAEANYFYKYGGALGMVAKGSNKIKALMMLEAVKDALGKAIILNPKHIEARYALIELNLQLPLVLGGSEKKALRYSDELMNFSPVDGYLSIGKIDEHYSRYAKAEKEYKKAIEIGKSKKAYQKLSDLYRIKMKQPQKAKEVMDAFEKKSK
jgi:tetratricopeptide (TPR) repeat protein